MLFGKKLGVFKIVGIIVLVAVALFFVFKASITGSIV